MRAALALVLLVSCTAPAHKEAPTPTPTPTSTPTPTPTPTPSQPEVAHQAELPPLGGEWMQTLDAPDGTPVGIGTVPLGSRQRRPLVVGVHGAQSRPDWMCGAVRDSFGPDTFVVCPHPTAKLREATSWGSGLQLTRAVDRALDAAFAAFGERIDPQKIIYFGHSQGGMMLSAGYGVVPPKRSFSSVVFFEGLPKDTSTLDRTVRNLGARRVLFVSGQSDWAAAQATAALRKNGLDARHVQGTFGHFFTPAAIEIFRRETPALLDAAD